MTREMDLWPKRPVNVAVELSTAPFFVEKVRDIVGLYLNPPENAMVLCIDEKICFRSSPLTEPYVRTSYTAPVRTYPLGMSGSTPTSSDSRSTTPSCLNQLLGMAQCAS